MKKVYRNVGEGVRRLVAQEFCHPDWQGMAVAAHRLSLTEQIDRLLAVGQLDRQQIQILPHQVNAVMTAINKLRTRAILADEVGLGKTIEAGLILKEYLARGLVRRVLILVPAPLVTQWQAEMRLKFGEHFAIAKSGKQDEEDCMFAAYGDQDMLIASLDGAKQPANAEALLAKPWDMVIVDEAHRLKNGQTNAHRFVAKLETRFLLMLTATPVQNSLFELYSLVNLVQEGLLGTPEYFKETFAADKNGRVLKNADRLGALLSRVMVRHRRADVGITFANRLVETVVLQGTPAELALHEAVLDYVRGGSGPGPDGVKGLRTLTFIRLSRMMASSPQALASTVRGMLSAAECTDAPALGRILGLAREVGTNSKTEALLRTLGELDAKEPDAGAIVFTSFIETQSYLCERLAAAGYPAIPYNGRMNQAEKDAAIAAFKAGEARVLVATDAGSEGVNLQFAHVLINYDLPWNPMRVEQRIGRVHRIGQQRDVIIVNMAIRDTVEEYILELLDQKIRLFNNAVGETDMILSSMRGFESFEKSVIDMIANAREPRMLRYQFEAFGDGLALAKQAADQIKDFDASTLALLDLSALDGPVMDPVSARTA